MRNTLIIIDKLEKLDIYLNEIYPNFPKKNKLLKEKIQETIKNIYLNIYIIVYHYNQDTGIETISLIKYLNNLFEYMYQKKVINNHKYLYIGNLVIDITKLLRGYLNEKSK